MLAISLLSLCINQLPTLHHELPFYRLRFSLKLRALLGQFHPSSKPATCLLLNLSNPYTLKGHSGGSISTDSPPPVNTLGVNKTFRPLGMALCLKYPQAGWFRSSYSALSVIGCIGDTECVQHPYMLPAMPFHHCGVPLHLASLKNQH